MMARNKVTDAAAEIDELADSIVRECQDRLSADAPDIQALQVEVSRLLRDRLPALWEWSSQESEIEQFQARCNRQVDALSLLTDAIDPPAQSDETDDWELTDIRWRERIDAMHKEIARLRELVRQCRAEINWRPGVDRDLLDEITRVAEAGKEEPDD